MKHFFSSFKRLQWKLTFSYALTTALVLLLIEIIGIIAAFVYTNTNVKALLTSNLQQEALQATPYFVHSGIPDQGELRSWLNIQAPSYFAGAPTVQASLTVVDRQGLVITAIGSSAAPPGVLLQTRLPHQVATHLQMIVAGKAQGLADDMPDGSMVVIVPIEGSDKVVHGALVQNTIAHYLVQQDKYWITFYLFQVILPSLLALAVNAGIVGTIFGFMTTRGFTGRFKRLSSVVDNWGQGIFSTFVKDSSGDEVGQLSRHLDEMAEQLQNLLQTRQKLAILEERNRLARDLHDSVKQQVFAVSMQVARRRRCLEVIETRRRPTWPKPNILCARRNRNSRR
jgi:two-component system, NarL family, sensor histidine kinase LiaS